MRIALGADHAGVDTKNRIAEHLRALGYEVEDIGPDTENSVDYPDYAFAVAERVSRGEADRGILVCGSGIGMSMAANKVDGVRAALCFSAENAALTRQHNDANVLAIAGRQSAVADVLEMVDSFLTTEFDGGRHARRVDKMMEYEKRRGQN
jgi:ribose 5-phosphate isomerase B